MVCVAVFDEWWYNIQTLTMIREYWYLLALKISGSIPTEWFIILVQVGLKSWMIEYRTYHMDSSNCKFGNNLNAIAFVLSFLFLAATWYWHGNNINILNCPVPCTTSTGTGWADNSYILMQDSTYSWFAEIEHSAVVFVFIVSYVDWLYCFICWWNTNRTASVVAETTWGQFHSHNTWCASHQLCLVNQLMFGDNDVGCHMQ